MGRGRPKLNREYALYKGEDIITMGTLDEIADELGVKRESVAYYRYPIYKKRTKAGNGRRLVLLD